MLLRETKDYPAEKIMLASESDLVVRASADHYAETGQLERATQTYRELLAKIMASNPDPEDDLEDAYHLSDHHAALATILRSSGRADEAASLEGHRMELWQRWNRKLPSNRFVLARLRPRPPTDGPWSPCRKCPAQLWSAPIVSWPGHRI